MILRIVSFTDIQRIFTFLCKTNIDHYICELLHFAAMQLVVLRDIGETPDIL